MFCFLNKSNPLPPKNQTESNTYSNQTFPTVSTPLISQKTDFLNKIFFNLFPIKSTIEPNLLLKLKLSNEKLIKSQSNTAKYILHKEACRIRQENIRKEICLVKKH